MMGVVHRDVSYLFRGRNDRFFLEKSSVSNVTIYKVVFISMYISINVPTF